MNSNLVKSSSIDIIIDAETPANAELCPKYKRSFAYSTITDRVPIIVTGIIDHLAKEKNIIAAEISQDNTNAVKVEVKSIIAELSELKYQIQTGKPLVRLAETGDPDTVEWNRNIREKEEEVVELTYYSGSWLFVECFIYRRIFEIISSTNLMKCWDPFGNKKKEILDSALSIVTVITDHLVCNKILENQPLKTCELIGELTRLVKFSLWANKIDLSITASSTEGHVKSLLIDEWDKDIIVNEIDNFLDFLFTPSSENIEERTIEFVLDNSGPEILCDLCLADFLMVRCGIGKINFRCKKMPWFVSDVMKKDFDDTIKAASGESGSLQAMAHRWNDYLDKGMWSVKCDDFWTRGLTYEMMEKEAPELYNELQKSYLVVLKGDLNYRKVVRDRAWAPTEPLATAVGSFRPTAILLLRTAKADTVAGLSPGVAERLTADSPDWMVSGNFGQIQFLPPL